MTQTLYIDYETYYTMDYSLSRMTTREYILDPRFEIMGAALAIDDDAPAWFDGDNLALVMASFDWPNTRVVCHNTMFDGAIMAWKFGARPKLWHDTMAMSQALLATAIGGASLARVGEHFGLHKDSAALMSMRGMRLADVNRQSEGWHRYVEYAKSDVAICREIFKKLSPAFPAAETIIVDTLLRMYIDNELRLDDYVVSQSLAEVRAESAQILARAGIPSKEALRSRDQFANLLRSRGVEPPTKLSSATGEKTYAFAKNDLEFAALLDHEDPAVVALVEAKLDASSSLEETRAQRFMNLSRIGGGRLNVPLRYSAAHTHRFGGSDNLNLQNLPRKSPLRSSIRAPKGYKMVVVDASQIEARMLAWMAGEEKIRAAFANGEDVYSQFASMIFGYKVNKKEHPDERFVGKTGILGLGYGTGWKKFQWSLLTSPFYDGTAPEDFCQKTVETYRTSYSRIPIFWQRCDELLKSMAEGKNDRLKFLRFGNRHMVLPSGLPMYYPQLHFKDASEFKDRGYVYWSSRYKMWKKIYGAAFTENIIQAISRIVITNAMITMRATDPDYYCCLQVHDELGYLVPERKAERAYHHLMQFMCTVPTWADESLPLAAEGGWGDVYAEIK